MLARLEVPVPTGGGERVHTCQSCGVPLGVVTRPKGGPTVLTPYPGVGLAEITGGVVWLRCRCAALTPWFVMSRRTLRPTG